MGRLALIDGNIAAAAATAEKCLRATLSGSHSALLSYGKSGTGKTYATQLFIERLLQEMLPASPTAKDDLNSSAPLAGTQVCDDLTIPVQLRVNRNFLQSIWHFDTSF